jgi:hypothetical protein
MKMFRFLLVLVISALLSGIAGAKIITGLTRGSGGGAPPSTEVAFVGTPTLAQSSSNGSFGVTVPADADAIYVVIAGYEAGVGNPMVTSLNFDGAGTDFVNEDGYEYSSDTADGYVVQLYSMTSNDSDWPGSGSKTINYTATAYTYGYNFYVFYSENNNLTTPIGNTGGHYVQSTSYTSSLTGVGSNDMGVIACGALAATPDVNPASSGQTALTETAPFNSVGFGVGYELAESALQATGNDRICFAFVIEAATQ